jgi:hypothetical protein
MGTASTTQKRPVRSTIGLRRGVVQAFTAAVDALLADAVRHGRGSPKLTTRRSTPKNGLPSRWRHLGRAAGWVGHFNPRKPGASPRATRARRATQRARELAPGRANRRAPRRQRRSRVARARAGPSCDGDGEPAAHRQRAVAVQRSRAVVRRGSHLRSPGRSTGGST